MVKNYLNTVIALKTKKDTLLFVFIRFCTLLYNSEIKIINYKNLHHIKYYRTGANLFNLVLLSTMFFLLGLEGLQAQTATPATGGEATGPGGTVSYSIGQVVFTAKTGETGSITQGVQQPFEISTIKGNDVPEITLLLSVFPNPTTDYITLKVKNYIILKVKNLDRSTIKFGLYDINGRLIKSNNVFNSNTTIRMASLPNSIYFLKVAIRQKLVKTFKIIKN